MHEDHLKTNPWDTADQIDSPSEPHPETPEDEYEEITVEEVDRVVAALDDLIQSVDSENIKWILEEAIDCVSDLLFDDDEDDREASQGEPGAAAA